MEAPDELGTGVPYHLEPNRKMSRRRRAATRKKPRPFGPEFHDLERRMMPTGFLVSTVADSGAGSLRQAILDSNATPGLNTIDFGIGVGPKIISPDSPLPQVTNTVAIDGRTQQEDYVFPPIELDGSSAGGGAIGLEFIAGSGASTVVGLFIDDFDQAAISIASNGVVVQNCYIGTNPQISDHPPMTYGVVLHGANNTVGGTTLGSGTVIEGTSSAVLISGSSAIGNVISSTSLTNHNIGVEISGGSGNTIGGTTAGAGNSILLSTYGVEFDDVNSSDNLVEGNQIGTDGVNAGLGNDFGVEINSGSGNTIGGTATGSSNVISDNFLVGVDVNGTGNLVEGNKIGTDMTGTAELGNYEGVQILGSSNTIGGTSASAGNLISGNMGFGVYLSNASSTGNLIEGNKIGTDFTGTVALANGVGVDIEFGPSANTIGGTAAGAGNLISGNDSNGIQITNGTSGTLVLGNTIGTDLSGSVALPNSIGVALFNAPGTTVGGTAAGAGNLISGNTNRGITVDGAFTPAALIEGNRIGTDAAGTAALSNNQAVVLESPGNTVGGTAAGAANLISGNAFQGVGIGVGATGNLVLGNQIGTNAAGNAVLGNGTGVAIGSAGNTIGGTAIGAGNLLSGNTSGVYISAPDNLVEGNRIGTDVQGTLVVANATGVDVHSFANTIGGTASDAGNLISGNSFAGVFVGTEAPGNLVEGNSIGTDVSGTVALGNVTGVVIEASGNTIGGSVAGGRNLISGNTFDGVSITVDGNLVEGNLIGTDAAGKVIGQRGAGVAIGASGNTIGGTGTGAGERALR